VARTGCLDGAWGIDGTAHSRCLERTEHIEQALYPKRAKSIEHTEQSDYPKRAKSIEHIVRGKQNATSEYANRSVRRSAALRRRRRRPGRIADAVDRAERKPLGLSGHC